MIYEAKLKPCPFCGSKNINITPVIVKASTDELLGNPVDVLAARVICNECGANILKYEKPTQKLWRLQHQSTLGTISSEDNAQAWADFERYVWKPAISAWNRRVHS